MKNLLRKILPDFVFWLYHWFLSLTGALFYGFPSKKTKVIGVTGTNGKSTVVFLLSNLLEKTGCRVASISSIQFKAGSKVWVNDLKMTMPGRWRIQKFINQAVEAKCDYVLLEVTSEGIKQARHKFIDFDLAVFTNLTKEHIESHKGFDNYKEAKAKLFKSLKKKGKAVFNLDDKNIDYFLNSTNAKKMGYCIDKKEESLKNKQIQSKNILKAHNLNLKSNGFSFKLRERIFNLKLLGKFNAYNALAVIAVGLIEGFSLDKIKNALEDVKSIPGRLEIVSEKPLVIVDYAHTPDALEKVYQTLSFLKQGNSKLIGVLGAAGGGRDKWKRPELGRIASGYCDYFLLTNEDPYDEIIDNILKDIEEGVGSSKNYQKIADRKQAIKKAINLAGPEDVVIITGKGCEPWMCVGDGKKIKWDDRKIIKDFLGG